MNIAGNVSRTDTGFDHHGILSPYPEPMFLSHIGDNLSTKLRKNGIFILQDNKSVKRFTIAK